MLETRPRTSRGRRAAGTSRVTPTGRADRGRSPVRLPRSACRPAWRAASTPRRSTTRRTSRTPSARTSRSSTSTPSTGKVVGPPLHRRRRLRRADQPDDRRGPDSRRAGRGDRAGAHADDLVRRAGQVPERIVHASTCCRPRSSAPRSSSARPSRRARTTRSAPRASASRPGVGSPPCIANAVVDALYQRAASRTSTCPALRAACGPPCRRASLGPPAIRRRSRGGEHAHALEADHRRTPAALAGSGLVACGGEEKAAEHALGDRQGRSLHDCDAGLAEAPGRHQPDGGGPAPGHRLRQRSRLGELLDGRHDVPQGTRGDPAPSRSAAIMAIDRVLAPEAIDTGRLRNYVYCRFRPPRAISRSSTARRETNDAVLGGGDAPAPRVDEQQLKKSRGRAKIYAGEDRLRSRPSSPFAVITALSRRGKP